MSFPAASAEAAAAPGACESGAAPDDDRNASRAVGLRALQVTQANNMWALCG
ncbi:hypothetical protein S58_12980 [Bradyrhizobium oligotrophicum S58]|uniref:Uncharacterized protein n=1 Tax=Bradyrhizobium oligotrophicum S58 TaxID=1245469 RepID=M4Z287_9BRAD|nr:hypothetical protein S58_12980 [Bradyrhizobium oligotrophicum S58]